MQQTKSLKTRWLNLMLHFSGIINKYKLKVIETTGPKVILYSFWVLLLEIANILISLPAFAFIAPQEFVGSLPAGEAGDSSAIKSYRLRRIVSLSVLVGIVFSVFMWILVSFFGLVLFPGHSYAALASWDFNTPLAYNYDTTKIQITDGTAIFKASQIISPTTPTQTEGQVGAPTENVGTETPTVDTGTGSTDTTLPVEETVAEPVPITEPMSEPISEPAPVVEPTSAPVVEPALDPGPLLLDNPRQLFKTPVAYAQTNTCSATLQTITPLVVTPFVKWTGFSETANKNGGEIYYTLSGDGGILWLHWNDSSWVDAGAHKGNIATEINNHISDFPITLTEVGAGTLMFKATFESDCSQDVSLLSLTADYQDQPSVIASFTSSETGAATTTTVITSEANPTVVVALDSISTGTDTSLTTDTIVATGLPAEALPTGQAGLAQAGLATPIAFSVHIVTETTGTPGRTLYFIPGLVFVSEGPDNGLVVNVTATDLQTTTLSSSANVTVGDHIVVLVYDGSTLKLYIDGTVSASLSAPIVILPPAQVSTSIGCVSAGFVLEALTLAKINANYLECNSQAPTLNITEATQKNEGGSAHIIYTATDADNDFVSIPVYEYSTTGAFAGEESTMTVATLNTDHDGTNGLVARDTGTGHTFVWNAKADLPNYAGNVYVRLRANDGLITGPVETFYPVRIDTSVSNLEISDGVGSTGSVSNVSVGGSSGDGPVISFTTNQSPTRTETAPADQNSNINPRANSTEDGIISSFVSTTDSVLQNTPELKSIAESRESGVLARPEVALVRKSLTGQTITFTGTGIPKAKIALFIHSDQVVVHTTDADAEGKWSFSHDQSALELAEGEHTVFVVTYDPGSKVKSKPSVVSTFYVNKSPAAVILGYTNLSTALLTLVVLLFGTLYIYSRRRETVR